MDEVSLTQRLIQFPSVTPHHAGSLDFIQAYLEERGFKCCRLTFNEVDNLVARRGSTGSHFCFAGHVDVVPVLDEAQWCFPPFDGKIHEGYLYGRGVADMKGAIGAFLAALDSCENPGGSISLLFTSDEEGLGVDGIKRVLPCLKEDGNIPDFCLVGEPTNPVNVGEMVKVGRRGSLTVTVTAKGVAGHIAYPENAINPISLLLDYLNLVRNHVFKDEDENFQATHCEISTIDVGNPTSNVIPSQAKATFNIRYNPQQNGGKLLEVLENYRKPFQGRVELSYKESGEAFLGATPQSRQLLSQAIQDVIGKTPVFSTSGGTSDARFIKDYCPVIEFGLVSQTAHQMNERVLVEEIKTLRKIYERVLTLFFASSQS